MSGTDIKVCVTFGEESPFKREWLWARVIGPDLVKLQNVPFFAPHLGLWDLVRINAEREIIGVVEKCTATQMASYETEGLAEAEISERCRLIGDHLRSYSIHPEGMVPGTLVMSVPVDIDDAKLSAIVADCPVPLSIVEDDE